MVNYLVLDLETLPHIVNVWSLYKPFVTYDNLLKETSIICGSYSYLYPKTREYSEAESVSVSDDKKEFRNDPYYDEQVVRKLHEVVMDADVLVGHNVKSFDLKVLNGRALRWGLDPIPPKPIVDTLTALRKHFRLPSNRLDDVCKQLGLGKKIPTTYSLWKEVQKGNIDACREMVRYCGHDVEITCELFFRLSPWYQGHPAFNLINDEHDSCPRCLAEGTLYTNPSWQHIASTRVYPRYKCRNCGGWSRGTKSIRGVYVRN